MTTDKKFRASSRKASTWRFIRPARFAGISSLVIVFLSISSAMGSSAGASTAPYHGIISVNVTKMASGCGHLVVSHVLAFQKKTGKALAATAGDAPTCQASSKLSTLDSAGYYGTMLVAIPLAGVSSATTSVTANMSWRMTSTLTTSDGYGVGAAAPCKSPSYTYDDTSSNFEWSYNNTTGVYFYDNTTDVQISNHVRSVSWYGNAPVPKHFVRNSTDAFDIEHEFGGYRSCTAISDVLLTVSGVLWDKTLGAGFGPSGNTLDNLYGQVFTAQVDIVNTTNWDCYSMKSWDGPSHHLSKPTLSCVSYNATTRAFVLAAPLLHRIHSYANNTQTWTGTYAHKGTFWWNVSAPSLTFKSSDKYELQLTLILSTASTNSWPLGSAMWSFNMGSGSFGMDLHDISVT